MTFSIVYVLSTTKVFTLNLPTSHVLDNAIWKNKMLLSWRHCIFRYGCQILILTCKLMILYTKKILGGCQEKKTNENKKKFASSFQTKQFWKLDKNMISLYFIAVINGSPFVFWIINFHFSLSWHFEKKIRVILLRKARKEEITYFLCFVHPIFSSFGFWYFGHFSCMIFFPVFFRLAHLALQN